MVVEIMLAWLLVSVLAAVLFAALLAGARHGSRQTAVPRGPDRRRQPPGPRARGRERRRGLADRRRPWPPSGLADGRLPRSGT